MAESRGAIGNRQSAISQKAFCWLLAVGGWLLA